jgi:uncharacterized small protein (DUF1192 family)
VASYFARTFRRTAADEGWDDAATQTLDPSDSMLEPARTHRPFDVNAQAAERKRLPGGLVRPILAVPIGDRLRCLALALWRTRPATTSTMMSTMLTELADKAASAFMKLNDDELRQRVATLESELHTIGAELAKTSARHTGP